MRGSFRSARASKKTMGRREREEAGRWLGGRWKKIRWEKKKQGPGIKGIAMLLVSLEDWVQIALKSWKEQPHLEMSDNLPEK